MNLQILSAVIFIAFMIVFMIIMWKIYIGMKRFLSENIREVLIASGEYIGEQIQTSEHSMKERMNALEKSNYALREEITRRLEAIAAALNETNDKAETGINSIVKELNDGIHSICDEMTKLLASISKNLDSFQKDTIKNLEAEIKRLIQVIDKSCENLEKSSKEQRNLLTNMAGTIQSVLTNGEMDIQSAFNTTHRTLTNMIEDSMNKINADYQNNMKNMFQAMADNLAAITQELRRANTPVEPAAPIDSVVPDEPAPTPKAKPETKKTTKGQKKKTDDASSGNTTKNKTKNEDSK